MAIVLTLDKPAGYAKGDKVTLTVVDPTRIVDTPITLPGVTTGISSEDLIVVATPKTPQATGYTFTQVSDDTKTGTTVWTTTA